jgi:hypothetical protein
MLKLSGTSSTRPKLQPEEAGLSTLDTPEEAGPPMLDTPDEPGSTTLARQKKNRIGSPTDVDASETDS